ncbi:MAG TPA: GNAT family N-acetyltransferase [Porticoccaceae bacterium]|nr:GNAT family N-acetyltransferase [Porticoccaceae bacterium]HIK80549.1 GNAT family N-acetyltransferase [Porticoccaceae bacterium]
MSAVTVTETTWEKDQVAIKSVRVPVFVEEQHVPYDIDFDDFDANAVHWLAYDANLIPIGTARMLIDGRFGRMAVLKPSRNQGVGRLIMLAAIDYATALGMPAMFLHAQLPALAFYQSLGFEPYGEVFRDAGMDHMAMRIDL